MPLQNSAFADSNDDLTGGNAMSQGRNLPLSPFDIDLNATALSWYGFVGDSGGVLPEGNPSLPSNTGETMNSSTGHTVSGGIAHNAIGHRNPMFWFLIVVLIFVGYLGFGFDFKLKKFGKAGAKIGG